MKAVYFTEHGGTEVLTYGELPELPIGPNEVRVRVRACALNRLDLYTRMGVRGTRMGLDQPHVLGGDSAGDVAEVGSEVTMVNVGDRVVVNPKLTCGQCQYCVAGDDELCIAPGMLGSTQNGSYAECVTIPAANAVRIPETISYEEAASLPTVFMPSWNILVRRAALKPWETVLILSASSGVGTAAIQVAKNVIGARVIATTSSPEKAKKARELGADEVIDYSTEDIEKRVKELTNRRGVHVVLDHVGADFSQPPTGHSRPEAATASAELPPATRPSCRWVRCSSRIRPCSASSWATRKTSASSSRWWPEEPYTASSTPRSHLKTPPEPMKPWKSGHFSAS